MSRRRKVTILACALAVVAASVLAIQRVALSPDAPAFRFAPVLRGDLQSIVSSTGTLQAVTTVSVGTQVSGQVSQLLVDFNDQVKKGQLLARIDPTIAQQAVADAQANLEKLKAQTNQALRDQNRNTELSTNGLIPQNMLEQGDAALQVARAGEKSAQIALSRAQQNLSYTSIYAPIDGVVVERNVNNGQTVAASLSAPQLFLIANDLTQMQILAQVGESDIEQIHQDQSVKFTVQALPGQTFTGTVQQVRLQSTTVDNVVNYTVVVRLENPERKLLPGMTARVDFLVKTSVGVLKVSNAALRFKPSEEILEQLGPVSTPSPRAAAATATPATTATTPDAAGTPDSNRPERTGRGGAGGRSGGRDSSDGAPRRAAATLYTLGPDGKLHALRVRTGITDGVSTEIEGNGVAEGMQVIVGLASSTTTQKAPANPLAGTPQGGGGRGRGGGPF